jgi:hypothetical protein
MAKFPVHHRPCWGGFGKRVVVVVVLVLVVWLGVVLPPPRALALAAVVSALAAVAGFVRAQKAAV